MIQIPSDPYLIAALLLSVVELTQTARRRRPYRRTVARRTVLDRPRPAHRYHRHRADHGLESRHRPGNGAQLRRTRLDRHRDVRANRKKPTNCRPLPKQNSNVTVERLDLLDHDGHRRSGDRNCPTTPIDVLMLNAASARRTTTIRIFGRLRLLDTDALGVRRERGRADERWPRPSPNSVGPKRPEENRCDHEPAGLDRQCFQLRRSSFTTRARRR